jgi:rod shape-determining protein MreD
VTHLPKGLVVASLLVFAVVIQTTLFGQIRFVSPDLVMLLVILLGLTKIRPELLLGISFLSGLLVDLLGSSLLGLRAVVFTVVAYTAIRTRHRAAIGRFAVAMWSGVLTLIGVVLLVLIGTLFGESSLLGPDVATHLLVVPLANMVLAALFGPLFVRLIDGNTGTVRFK